MNILGIGRWLEWIGVRAVRATRPPDPPAVDLGLRAFKVLADAMNVSLTLLRQQNERQEQVMTLIQQIKDALATVLSKEAAIEAKEDALVAFAKASQAKVTQLQGLLADALAKLQAGDAGSIAEDLTGIQGQLQLLNASLDTDAGKLDAALADPPAGTAPPTGTTTAPPAPTEETTVDTKPAIEPAPEPDLTPTDETDKQLDEQIAASPNPAGDAPVAPTEG